MEKGIFLNSFDSDFDGLCDDDEALIGTDSQKPDTDGNRATAGFEMQGYVDLSEFGISEFGIAQAAMRNRRDRGGAPKGVKNPSNSKEDDERKNR